MRLELKQPTGVDASAPVEPRDQSKTVAGLTSAECDAVYRVIFAGDADPRHPYRWNPNR